MHIFSWEGCLRTCLAVFLDLVGDGSQSKETTWASVILIKVVPEMKSSMNQLIALLEKLRLMVVIIG